MRDHLLADEFNDRIPAGLPTGTPVAHKTGDITAVAHDAGALVLVDAAQSVPHMPVHAPVSALMFE